MKKRRVKHAGGLRSEPHGAANSSCITRVKPCATDITQEELKQTRTRMGRWPAAVAEICVLPPSTVATPPLSRSNQTA